MDDYTLFDLHGILKTHEKDIVEKINESAIGGSFALLSKENMMRRSVVNAHDEENDDVDEQHDLNNSRELDYAFVANSNAEKFYRNNAGNSKFKQSFNKFNQNKFQVNSDKFKHVVVDEKSVGKRGEAKELLGG